ncbi:MAG: rod shape-determining protein RodA [Actinomycetia bacterium]|nr:rod shape-determining protein RodA [Actinomycetes bacterium]
MGERSVWREMDWVTLGLVGLLALLSLFVIAAATASLLPHDPLYFVKRQLVWITLGAVALAVTVSVPYATVAGWWKYLYGANLLLLGLVLVKGHSALGASRWIDLGPFQLQPSELAKVLIIVTLAQHLTRKTSLKRWRDLASPIAHVAVPMLLIMKQPDLGTSLVFVAILGVMLFTAGAPGRKLLLLFGGGLGVVVLWIYAHFHWTIGHHPIPIFMHDYQLKRLLIFLNPNQDPMGAGYNVIQSRIAVGTGGLWGTGLVGGHQNGQLSFLPESYTDFAFAVVADQLGFIGSVGVLLVYFLILVRGLYVAVNARDRLGTLMASGVVAMLGFHVLESAGMATGIMPVAGVPLPFVSYGGSAFLADAMAVGLLMNVYARRQDLVFRANPPPVRVGRSGSVAAGG